MAELRKGEVAGRIRGTGAKLKMATVLTSNPNMTPRQARFSDIANKQTPGQFRNRKK